MGALHGLRAREIGDSSRHPQHAVIAARRQPHGFRRIGEEAFARGIRRCRGIEDFAFRFRIGANAAAIIPFALYRPRVRHALGDGRAAFGRRRERQILRGDTVHLHMNVDAVEQRP